MRARLFAAAALAAGLAAPSSAAVMVLGKGPGNACYEAATAEQASRTAFADCAAALEDATLTTRDRAATFVNRAVLWLVRERPSEALADVDAADGLLPGLAARTSIAARRSSCWSATARRWSR